MAKAKAKKKQAPKKNPGKHLAEKSGGKKKK
jgi:hypothetical protein